MARNKPKPGEVVKCGKCERNLVGYPNTPPPEGVDASKLFGASRVGGRRPTKTVMCPTCAVYTTVEL